MMRTHGLSLPPNPAVIINRSACVLLAIAALSWAGQAAAKDPAQPFAPALKPYLEAHCLDCHGPDSQRAGLRLDTLPVDLREQAAMSAWVKVRDKVSAGDMPPKKRERPPQADSESVVRALDQALHAASLDRQQKQGRVGVRRLNSTEFENTVRDLVGTKINLKDLLPEDGTSAGFDNVSATLDISATHLLRYQEAAEKAIMSVVPTRPHVPFSDKRTGRQISEKGQNFYLRKGLTWRLQDDSLVIYARLIRFAECRNDNVPVSGRYRVQISAGAIGTGDKPLAAGLFTIERGGRDEPVLRDVRDFAPGKPRVVELEIDLKQGHALCLNLFNVNLDRPNKDRKAPLEEYTGAGLVVEWMKIEGPLGPWPPASYEKLFAGVPLKPQSVAKAESAGQTAPTISPNRSQQEWLNDPLVPASANPKRDAERLIRAFLPRAFRRPVSEETVKFFLKRALDKLDKGDSFAEAMMFGFKSVLCSPHFLFLTEPGEAARVTASEELVNPRLDDHALASRLSYFLWSAPPDDELLELAKRGELVKPSVLRAQVERMLQSPKAEQFTENFVGQWLDLRKMTATIPDLKLYREFDGLLQWSMPRETELFFNEVLRNDLSVLNFVQSDWTMLNARLAAHYGVPGVVGNDFRKVKLPPGCHRGGVLTHASVLKVTADGTRTSPVLRGKWVLDRIIGKPPADPPPDVPAIEPDIRGSTTIRQQLDKHRQIASCAACHAHIDPPGFVLENFDPIGGWRDFYRASVQTKRGIVRGTSYYRGPDVEQGAELADGRKFRDIDEYKQMLLEDKDQIARNLARKLMIYSTGADIQFADREVVEQIVDNVRAKNYGLRSMVHEVTQSRVFLNK
jgi:mono/diheme cytochrome c family protein